MLIRCVFLSPVRRYLHVFLGLYRAKREISSIRFVLHILIADRYFGKNTGR